MSSKPLTSHAMPFDHSPSSAVTSSDFSSTSALTQLLPDTGDETLLVDSPLRPGFAQSFQVPVSFNRYVPYKSSLAFPSSPPYDLKRRSVLKEVSGNEQRLGESEQRSKEHDERTCECCSKMRDEIQELKDELAELKRLVKGKGRN